MKNMLPVLNGFLIALAIVMAFVFWKTFPTRPLYLSDIPELETVVKTWDDPQRDRTIQGNSIIIDEKYYEKGLGVHAKSEIKVPVPPGYTHFTADIGINDEVPDHAPASVRFTLIGDGTVLFESSVIRADMPPKRIFINVEWIAELTLRVDDAEDGENSDHADWANARFIRR